MSLTITPSTLAGEGWGEGTKQHSMDKRGVGFA